MSGSEKPSNKLPSWVSSSSLHHNSADFLLAPEMTVAELFQIAPLSSSLRKRVIQDPFFESCSVLEITRTPWSLEEFLRKCKALPQCGEKQISIIRTIVAGLLLADTHPDDVVQKAPEARFHYSYIDSVEEVFLRFWRESYLQEFFYLPSTLPEFFKCRSVLEAELSADVLPSGYVEKISAIATASGSLQQNLVGTVLIDAAAFEAIFEGRGRYASIRGSDLKIQKRQLLAMCEAFPSVDFCLVDFIKHGLSSGWVSSRISVVHAMGGYLIFPNTDYSSKLFEKCRSATDAGTSLTTALRDR